MANPNWLCSNLKDEIESKLEKLFSKRAEVVRMMQSESIVDLDYIVSDIFAVGDTIDVLLSENVSNNKRKLTNMIEPIPKKRQKTA